ncbi:MAG: F0F1 ATP synthase subunit delta [Treponema sp.]|nr:F0F1 ATP synthase subunit delta [Treponema sp.]
MKFAPDRWAEAFINTMGDDAAEAFTILKILNDWAVRLPGAVSGTAIFGELSAQQMEKLILKAAAKLGLENSRSLEGASHFLILMVKKNILNLCGSVIEEIGKLIDLDNKTVSAVLEYVKQPGKELEDKITEIIKEQLHANEVRLIKKSEPALIGGFRLRIGDRVIDASVLSQLKNMEAVLALPETQPAGLSNGVA